MKRMNVVVAKHYEKDGEQKKAWKNVGQLIIWEAKGDKPESYQLELNLFADTKFYIFEQKAKEQESKPFNSDDAF